MIYARSGERSRAGCWLKKAVRRIIAKAHPRRIILFGSQAYGRTHPESDIDLLVVLEAPGDRFMRYTLVDKAVGDHVWPLDLLVRTPDEMAERLRMGDPFYRRILRRGTVLYES